MNSRVYYNIKFESELVWSRENHNDNRCNGLPINMYGRMGGAPVSAVNPY